MKINQRNKKFNDELLNRFPGIIKEFNDFWVGNMAKDDGDTIVFEMPLCDYAYRMLREGNEGELRKILQYVTDLACKPNRHHDAALFFMESVRKLPGWSLMTQYFPKNGKEIFLSPDNDSGPDIMDERGIYDPNTYWELYEGNQP